MITVDIERGTISVDENGLTRDYQLDTPEAFKIISDIWLRAGWDNKYVYSFTWLGRPIIQLPEDVFRLQELIHTVRPDVIVETAVGHAGFDDYVRTHCVDQFLEPEHIFRQLDDRPSEPGETVDVLVVPARAQPNVGNDLECLGRVELVVARETVFVDADRASFHVDGDHCVELSSEYNFTK